MDTEHRSVFILTQYFYPDVPGTAQIATDLAESLTECNFDINVFTGQPAYVNATKIPSKDRYKGVTIHRAYSHSLSQNRISSTGHISRFFNMGTVAFETLFKLLVNSKPNILLVDSTSPLLLMVAWVINKLRHVPFVVIVHDVYPEVALELKIIRRGSLIEKIWRFAYRNVYNSSSKIIVLGPHMKKIVVQNIAAGSQSKCVVIPNWADGDFIVPMSASKNLMRETLGLKDHLVVMYSGNMGPAHDMYTILGGAEKLKCIPEIKFLLIGGGGSHAWVKSRVEEMRLTNVSMLPYQPQHILPHSLTCGDISLITQTAGMEGLSVPSKIYSSLAAGLAIIGIVGEKSEVGDILKRHECGTRVEQGDIEGLVQTIQHLHNNRDKLNGMKINARRCFNENYTRKIAVREYSTVLQNLMSCK